MVFLTPPGVEAFASEAVPRVAESDIQVYGGGGFTWECDIHLDYKRLLTLQHSTSGVGESLEEIAHLILD